MNPFKKFKAWLGRGKQKAPGGAPALTGPRYYHPFDLNSMTCRRCGVSYVVAAKVPCKSAPPVIRRPTPLDAIEHHEAPPTIHTPLDANAWAEAFGPLSSTFRLPEAPPEEPFAGAGGTFGGAGASASWDTSPASAPSSSSIPDSDSPSSESSSGGSDSESSSSSSDSGSSDFSSGSGGDSGENAD